MPPPPAIIPAPPAAIARRRVVTGHATTARSSDPELSPLVRLREFPDRGLTISAGKLFCTICRKEVAVKKSTVEKHLDSDLHKQNKEAIDKEKEKQAIITQLFVRQCEQGGPTPSGSSLPLPQIAFRAVVLEVFLRAGTPLSRFEIFRPLLEKAGYALTTAGHLSEFTSLILEKERFLLRDRLKGQDLFLIFDGTTRLGEAFVVVARWVDENMNLYEHILKFKTLRASMNAPQMQHEIFTYLAEAGSSLERLVGCNRDGASVNQAAMDIMLAIKAELLDLRCLAHFVNLVGEKIDSKRVDDFMAGWRKMMGKSPKAQGIFKSIAKTAYITTSDTRWWSEWEQIKQVCELWPAVRRFLEHPEAPESKTKLLPMMDLELSVHLAAVMDFGAKFAEASTMLQGKDVDVVTKTFDIMDSLREFCASPTCPNVAALLRREGVNYDINAIITPAIDYFNSSWPSLRTSIFRALRLLDPARINNIDVTDEDLSLLGDMERLRYELPSYLSAAKGATGPVLDWWRANEVSPNWRRAARRFLAVAPSSAAAERAFSKLNAYLNEHQDGLLDDKIEAMLMLQTNN